MIISARFRAGAIGGLFGALVLAALLPLAHGAEYVFNALPVSPTAADVSKATCGSGDAPEDLLQGQVPLYARLAGFKGHSCNLKLLSAAHSSRGDGLWQQFVTVRDRAGHLCGYGGPVDFTQGAPGTTVVDLTDPFHLHETAVITTPGLMYPGEGIRASTRAGLLVGAYYKNFPSAKEVTHGFDVYDVGSDCRHPKRLASTTVSFPTAGLTAGFPRVDKTYGHEGAISPDGKTYYECDFPHGVVQVMDLSDPRHPKWLAGFAAPTWYKKLATCHGISVSDDGNRAYAASVADATVSEGKVEQLGAVPQKGEWHDGFLVLDTSEVQARKANPKIRLISESDWYDGSMAQMTIPVEVGGKPYLITTNEGGVGLAERDGIRTACAEGRTPFGMVRIFDLGNETKPRLVKALVLQMNDPKNCSLIMPEVAAMGSGQSWLNYFLYDVHMCSVDNRDNATTLACGYFNSGIRVYDIRDPAHTSEIAYWVPPAKGPGRIGWCAAIPTLDASKGMLYSSCADSGVVALKFTHGAWPFPTSSTPPDKQL